VNTRARTRPVCGYLYACARARAYSVRSHVGV